MPAGPSLLATDDAPFKKPLVGVRSHGHDVQIRGSRTTDFLKSETRVSASLNRGVDDDPTLSPTTPIHNGRGRRGTRCSCESDTSNRDRHVIEAMRLACENQAIGAIGRIEGLLRIHADLSRQQLDLAGTADSGAAVVIDVHA